MPGVADFVADSVADFVADLVAGVADVLRSSGSVADLLQSSIWRAAKERLGAQRSPSMKFKQEPKGFNGSPKAPR